MSEDIVLHYHLQCIPCTNSMECPVVIKKAFPATDIFLKWTIAPKSRPLWQHMVLCVHDVPLDVTIRDLMFMIHLELGLESYWYNLVVGSSPLESSRTLEHYSAGGLCPGSDKSNPIFLVASSEHAPDTPKGAASLTSQQLCAKRNNEDALIQPPMRSSIL